MPLRLLVGFSFTTSTANKIDVNTSQPYSLHCFPEPVSSIYNSLVSNLQPLPHPIDWTNLQHMAKAWGIQSVGMQINTSLWPICMQAVMVRGPKEPSCCAGSGDHFPWLDKNNDSLRVTGVGGTT